MKKRANVSPCRDWGQPREGGQFDSQAQQPADGGGGGQEWVPPVHAPAPAPAPPAPEPAPAPVDAAELRRRRLERFS